MPCQDPITPCSPADPCSEICADDVQTKCIVTSEDYPAPINLTTGTSFPVVLQRINELLGSLNPANYANFDYGCFAGQNITTEQGFVTFMVTLLCQITGTQTLGNITSLSQLTTLVQSLTTQYNGIVNQNAISCFQTAASVPASLSLNTLLAAIQALLCDHASSIANLFATASSPAITVGNSNKSVILASSGTQGHALSATLNVSNDPNQAIVVNGDGSVFVQKQTPITIIPSTTATVTQSGTDGHTLKVEAKLSLNSGNQLADDGSGLYVSAAALSQTPLVATDSTTIDFTQGGVAGHNITAVVKIDPAGDNLLQQTGSGLKVAAGSISPGAQTPISPVDTQSVDLTTSGPNNHTIQADVKINPGAYNPIYIGGGGLDFDEIKLLNKIASNATARAIFCSIVSGCGGSESGPAITLNCGSATVPSFVNGTSSFGTLIVPVTVTGSGTVTMTATGTGLSGANSVAVTSGTTSISLTLTYDGSAPAGVRVVGISFTGTSNTPTCNINVTINAETDTVFVENSASGLLIQDVGGITGYTLTGPLGAGQSDSGSHSGGGMNILVDVNSGMVRGVVLRVNGVTVQCKGVAGIGAETLTFDPISVSISDVITISGVPVSC